MTDSELNIKFAKLAEAQAETEVQMQRTEVQMQRTEAQMQSTVAQMKLTDEQIKRTDEQLKRTDEKLERIGVRMGNIADNNGMNAEEYFFNSLEAKPFLGGIKYDDVKRNVYSFKQKLEDEYDIVMYNGNCVALIECKYKAHENDLRKLMDKKVDNFKELFPYYSGYKIYLGLASFSFYPELEEMAKQSGVAILKQKGEVMEIVADNLKVY